MQSQPEVKDQSIVVEGVVKSVLPGLEYIVEIDYNGIKHDVTCYVSGKMKSHYIQISRGDEVKVEISLYDIDKGRIVYRLTKRVVGQGPPRRAKK